MEDNNKDFLDFLKVTFGQKEVSLVVTKNDNELHYLSELMNNNGYKKIDDILEISNNKKSYIMVGENMKKSYDFLVQYPTGQVETFDNNKMESNIFSPDYVNSSVVLLLLKEDLIKFKEKGWDFMSFCGPAFQSNI